MTVEVTQATDLVNLTIDGIPVSVPKGTLVIRAAEQVGVQILRFCVHPLLDPVGACRQCLVEVGGQRKPAASCTITVIIKVSMRRVRPSVRSTMRPVTAPRAPATAPDTTRPLSGSVQPWAPRSPAT